MAQLLYNRGVTESAQVEPFIRADRELLYDPFLLCDMERAVARIEAALSSGETISIYGDFDADGVTATAILVDGFSALGGRVIPYIPRRTEEGYGLNNAALETLKGDGVGLVITVDCGISSAPEVERANEIGLDVIVTDHHTVPSQMPPAVAVVDPKRGDSCYPFPDLAGVGVAFKLLQALYYSLGRDDDLDQYLDLVALGTVTDMSPLVGENRYLVKHGIEALQRTERPGLLELARSAGIPVAGIDPEVISWVLGPRLNAAGRLDHAMRSYNLLATDSVEEAQRIASWIERKNSQRQALTEGVLADARAKVEAQGADRPLLMVGGEGYPSGVVGVVAGRLSEAYYRPVIVCEIGAEQVRGSARSIPEFDVTAALTQCCDLLSRFGGHPMAAGFTAPLENLGPLHDRLLEIAQAHLAGLDLRRSIAIDAQVRLDSLGGGAFSMMQRLAPFGRANPLPTFLSRGVAVEECRCVGGKGEHLKLKIRTNNVVWDTIGFRQGYLVGEVTPTIDIVYNLQVDQWSGGERLQLNMLDFAPRA